MTSLIASLAQLIDSTKEEQVKAMVAPMVVNKCDAAVANLDSNKTLIELILETGKGVVATAMKDSKESTTEATACSRIMRTHLVVNKPLVVKTN